MHESRAGPDSPVNMKVMAPLRNKRAERGQEKSKAD